MVCRLTSPVYGQPFRITVDPGLVLCDMLSEDPVT